MIQLEVFSRAAIYATGAVATIDRIDHFARNRRAIRLIAEQLPRIDEFQAYLLFQFSPALPFLQIFRDFSLLFFCTEANALRPFLFLQFFPEQQSAWRCIEFQDHVARR